MEGIFLRKKFNIWLFILFLCGLFFIGFYIFLNAVDSEATNELLTFLVMGILIILVVIPSWLLNFGAFIHIDENSIKAKYHWFGKIDCSISEVDFAFAQINTLTIQLKDGKVHTIAGIENSWELCSFIRRNMRFDVTEQPETLNEQLNKLKSAKQKGLIYVCSGIALMFINIFVTVFLTGERELHEFSKTDWKVMAIMGVVELATVIVTFWFAQRTGKNNVPIEKLKYYIPRIIVETKPLLPGNMLKVCTNENYMGRITLFGFPNKDSVYYSVEEFDCDYNLEKVFTSEIYEDIEHMPDVLDLLIDITENFSQ